jgi:TPR repeat protein
MAQLAAIGNAEGLFRAALKLANGMGVAKDFDTSLRYMKAAAGLGHAKAVSQVLGMDVRDSAPSSLTRSGRSLTPAPRCVPGNRPPTIFCSPRRHADATRPRARHKHKRRQYRDSRSAARNAVKACSYTARRMCAPSAA